MEVTAEAPDTTDATDVVDTLPKVLTEEETGRLLSQPNQVAKPDV